MFQFALPDGGGHSFFMAPSVTKPIVDKVAIPAEVSCPLGGSFCDSVGCDEIKPALVISLRGFASPSAIIWAIVSVIVNSVKRFTIRPVAHIDVEVLKSKPPIANRYTSTAVVFVGRIFRVCASLLHAAPYFVHAVVKLAVRGQLFLPAFLFKTSARVGTAAKMVKVCDFAVSAIAQTLPKCFSFLSVRKLNGDKPTKSLSCDVFFHNGALL